ncbi:MAG: EAL domain-containing protein [Pseudomonadota bacterium]|nr:EAL domain-containing protein [Pseudomonadota bacterium]
MAYRARALRFLQSLQGRIATALVCMVLFTQLVGSGVLYLVGGAVARSNASEAMGTAGRVAAEVLETRDHQLHLAASVLAADYGLRGALATRHLETLASALQNHAARIKADVALMLDDAGHPLVAVPELDALHLAAIGAAVNADTARRQGVAVLEWAGRLYQVVHVTVNAPLPVGSVVLGFALDRGITQGIQDITTTDVTVIDTDSHGKVTAHASTLPADAAATLAGVVNADTRHALPEQELRLASGLHLATVAPVGNSLGGDRRIALVLTRSVTAAMAPFWRLWQVLQIAALLVLLLAIVLGIGQARGIAAPLRELSRFARRLEAGHYDALPPVQRSDEIGELGQAFEHMRDGIASRERHIRALAYQDSLTGLSNRIALSETVAAQIEANPGQPLAVYLLDLDRFKFVNEVMGHPVGDTVLRQVAERLRGLAQYGVIDVARLGGDEFALVALLGHAELARALGEHIVELLHVPIVIDEVEVDACASVGVALYPAHGSDALSLLRCADLAMYHAKDRRGGITVFEPAHARTNSSSLNLLSELRRAVENDELVLYLQPKLSLSSNGKRAVEALVRWNHPTQGFMPPMNFIPFAEQTGFIRTITLWVLRESMKICVDWQQRGLPVQIAVNLSARDLVKPELPAEFRALLAETGCLAQAILLEVTESALADDPDLVLANLLDLRSLGCDIAIDDYGTGYSSLAYLERLPLTELKIDKGFVLNMLASPSDESIVQSTIDLAHRLGLKVTAEGVDSLAALELLRTYGCDTAQGFFLCRPVAPAMAESWYRDGRDRELLQDLLRNASHRAAAGDWRPVLAIAS